jgi:hypothetical protein
MPAQAGIQEGAAMVWIPAFAGMKAEACAELKSRQL